MRLKISFGVILDISSVERTINFYKNYLSLTYDIHIHIYFYSLAIINYYENHASVISHVHTHFKVY